MLVRAATVVEWGRATVVAVRAAVVAERREKRRREWRAAALLLAAACAATTAVLAAAAVRAAACARGAARMVEPNIVFALLLSCQKETSRLLYKRSAVENRAGKQALEGDLVGSPEERYLQDASLS